MHMCRFRCSLCPHADGHIDANKNFNQLSLEYKGTKAKDDEGVAKLCLPYIIQHCSSLRHQRALQAARLGASLVLRISRPEVVSHSFLSLCLLA